MSAAVLQRIMTQNPVKSTLTDQIIRQQEHIEKLESFIFRHHNKLELEDMEDCILVGNIIDGRSH